MLPHRSSSSSSPNPGETHLFTVSRAEWAVWTALSARLLDLKVADQLIEMVMSTVHFGVSLPVPFTDEELPDQFRFPNFYVMDKLIMAYERYPDEQDMVVTEQEMAGLVERVRGCQGGEAIVLDASAPFDLTAEVCVFFWYWAYRRSYVSQHLRDIDMLLDICETVEEAAADAESILSAEDSMELDKLGLSIPDFVHLALVFLLNCPAGTISLRFRAYIPPAGDIFRDLMSARELFLESSYATVDLKPAVLLIIQDIHAYLCPVLPSFPSLQVLHGISEHLFIRPVDYEVALGTDDIARLLVTWLQSPLGKRADAKLGSRSTYEEGGNLPQPPGKRFVRQVLYVLATSRQGRCDLHSYWLAWKKAACVLFGNEFSHTFLELVVSCVLSSTETATSTSSTCTLAEALDMRARAMQDQYKTSRRRTSFHYKQVSEVVALLVQDIFISLLLREAKLDVPGCYSKLDYSLLLSVQKRQPATNIEHAPRKFIYYMKWPDSVKWERDEDEERYVPKEFELKTS